MSTEASYAGGAKSKAISAEVPQKLAQSLRSAIKEGRFSPNES
jgi:hypothetical protein